MASEGIFSGRVAERSSTSPAILLGMFAVHLTALVDLDLVLDQLRIIVQLLQLDVPEELLEATYGRLLMRRRRHRVITKRKRSLVVKSIRDHCLVLSNLPDIFSLKCLISDLASPGIPRLAHASHNCSGHLRRNLFGIVSPSDFYGYRMLISSQKHLSIPPISQDGRYLVLILMLIDHVFRRNMIILPYNRNSNNLSSA